MRKQSEPDLGLVPAGKRLGQHLLLDEDILSRIVKAAEIPPDATVIEIGAGTGSLTKKLLERSRAVIAIEADPKCAPAGARLESYGKLTWRQADARKLDLPALSPEKTVIIGNLPYYAATFLLQQWLPRIESFHSLTLMFQLEVAQRIVAPANTAGYCRLSVLVAAVSRARIVMRLPAAVFTPPPKVSSALVHFVPSRQCDNAVYRSLQMVTRRGFAAGRKKLGKALAGSGAGHLFPEARAAQLDVVSWLQIAQRANLP